MSYATYAQLSQRYSEDALRMITDPNAQAVRVDVAEQALKDASDEIDLWIGRRYVLPLVLVNPETGVGTVIDGAPVLVRCCCDIAMYRMQPLRPADDIKDARARYEDALKLLKAMADGTAILPFRQIRLDAPDTQGAIGLPEFGQPDSLFGRGEPVSAIGNLESGIVNRLTAALTLPGQAHPKIEVRAWPERARDYKMTHPHGCAMVIYKGSGFSQDQSTAGHLVAREAKFELGLISRTLREPNTPESGMALGTGIYDLLETCSRALLGWQPEQAAGAVRIISDGFDDYAEGTWGYSLMFVVPMLTVAERHCPPGPWAFDGPNSCCDVAPPLTARHFIMP